MLANVLRGRKSLGLKTKDLGKFLKNQFILANGLRANKYIEYNGKVFLDVYAPHWPSKAMKRMIETYASNAGKPVDERIDFVDYMVVAITSRCMYRCKHCYTIHTLQKKDAMPFDVLADTIEKLLDIGVGILSLEGGEPLLRYDDLVKILAMVGGRADPWMATTGHSLTKDKAGELADAGLVGAAVSLDHFDPDKHNAFRNDRRAFDSAVNAVTLFRENGVFPATCLVAGKEMVNDGGLYEYMELTRELGVGFIQLVDPIPSGRYLDPEGEFILDEAERKKLVDFQIEVNTEPRFSDYPGVTARLYIEDGTRYGCGMGGNQAAYIDSSGNVEPCPYISLSLGNIMEEDFNTIFKRMRKLLPHPVAGLCPAYEICEDLHQAKLDEEDFPLKRELAEPIIERIAKREMPAIFKKTEGG
jgi:MoaA/NifB/PqqE/SkfB family radical SAM enzyme